jgi:hypothetical protein
MSKITETTVETSPPGLLFNSVLRESSFLNVLQNQLEIIQNKNSRISHHVISNDILSPAENLFSPSRAVETKVERIIAMHEVLEKPEFTQLSANILDRIEIIETTQKFKDILLMKQVIPLELRSKINSIYKQMVETLQINNQNLTIQDTQNTITAVEEAIRPLGYEILKCEANTLRFSNTSVSVICEIKKDGLLFDFKGFSDKKCDDEFEKLNNRLKECGIIIKIKSERYHREKQKKIQYNFNPLKSKTAINKQFESIKS